MALDIPRVEYVKEDNKGKGKSKQKKQPRILKDDPSIKLNEQAIIEARERKEKNKWKQIKLSDLNTLTNTDTNG